MIDKTIQKILKANQEGKLITDSDVYDFARENRLSFDDILCCIANNTPQFEKCWGCENILNRLYMSSYSECTYCSRRIQCKDNFKQSKKRYRTK